jgi:hypothetical protein
MFFFSKTYDEVNGKHCPAETEATKRALCVKARPTNILRLLRPIRYALSSRLPLIRLFAMFSSWLKMNIGQYNSCLRLLQYYRAFPLSHV